MASSSFELTSICFVSVINRAIQLRINIVVAISTFLAMLSNGNSGVVASELKVIQKPTFWIVGQWTRIVIETPDDCGRLDVTVPEQLTLLDRCRFKPGNSTQRFYFRATARVKSEELVFKSAEHKLTLPLRVLSWAEVLNERFERRITSGSAWAGKLKLPRLFPLDGTDEMKRGLSFLTRAELERQRESFSRNLKGHARDALPQVQDLHKLFHSLPSTTIPRAAYVNNPVYRPNDKPPAKGCPVCGIKIFEGRSAFYPWLLDRENHPLKVQCPECERWFPSNDFAAGDMTSGEFPDDGWGYFDDRGRPYSFVGYYVLQNYRGGERRTELYSRLYLANGDKRLARAATVLLFRVAEQYLNLALNINQRNRYVRDALWGGRIAPQGTPQPSNKAWFSPGFYLDAVWTIGPDRFYAEAYERIWDYLQEDDPVLLKFLQAQHHPEIKSMRDVRRFIETGYFRTVAQGLLDHSISGNGPSEHAMALNVARFLNTPRSIELADWVFNNSKDGMRYYLPNLLFKDGSGYESPAYNNAHSRGTVMIENLLSRLVELHPDQYANAGFPLLADQTRFKDMYDHNINLSLISRTYANVGDDGDLATTDPLPLKPGASLKGAGFVHAFEKWGDANYAKALWNAEAEAPIKALTDPALRAKVTEIVKREGPHLELPSQVLDGFGHVILRSGKAGDQRAFWMRYGSMYGHGHHDGLTIGYEALKRTLLPEQGYNRGPDYRTEWDMNWALHYCGRIVGAKDEPSDSWGQQGSAGGSLRLFADGGWAKMATAGRRHFKTVDPPQLMKLTNDLALKRTIGLIDLGPKHSYCVSIFRLSGGTDHYLSFHGPRGSAQSHNLKLIPQNAGTLAGPNVHYGQKWDSEWSKKNPHLMMFPFLFDVRRADANAAWNVRWDLENYPNVHLRLHGFGNCGEVALSKGKPPGGGKPYELQWLTRHNSGTTPLATQFVEVLEAYEGEPLISEVRPLTVKTSDTSPQGPVAFQVVSNDRIDTIIHCSNSDVPVTTSNGITMQGAFGVWSEEAGKPKRVFLVGGTKIEKQGRTFAARSQSWTATIESANFFEKKIVVSPAPADSAALVSRYVRITNPQGNDATHRIVASKLLTGDRVELTFEWDPRIAEGPVREVHSDGLTSAVALKFGGLYYRGKTLSNEDGTSTYKSFGVRTSRAYINNETHQDVSKSKLTQEFSDRDADKLVRFLIYDYGPGDTITMPTLMSVDTADK